MFGGRVRVCLTGAAPISPDVLNFMRCMLGVPFSEGNKKNCLTFKLEDFKV